MNGACLACSQALSALALVGFIVVCFLVLACLLWLNTRVDVSYRIAVAYIAINGLQVSVLKRVCSLRANLGALYV